MELINRELQRVLLERLGAVYPNTLSGKELRGMFGNGLEANVAYLDEHGLLTSRSTQTINAPPAIVAAKITAKGIDFLQDDGGLSAILGVVTIKFDESSLKALIAARIDASEATTEQKSSLKKHVGDLSAHSVKHLTEKLLDVGLSRAPDALRLIETALSGLGT